MEVRRIDASKVPALFFVADLTGKPLGGSFYRKVITDFVWDIFTFLSFSFPLFLLVCFAWLGLAYFALLWLSLFAMYINKVPILKFTILTGIAKGIRANSRVYLPS